MILDVLGSGPNRTVLGSGSFEAQQGPDEEMIPESPWQVLEGLRQVPLLPDSAGRGPRRNVTSLAASKEQISSCSVAHQRPAALALGIRRPGNVLRVSDGLRSQSSETLQFLCHQLDPQLISDCCFQSLLIFDCLWDDDP